MKRCDCLEILGPHHPSDHYAIKRDALMVRIEKFIDDKYPTFIFEGDFNRKQVALIAACFVLDQGEMGEII